MKNVLLILALCFVSPTLVLRSQDMQLTQFYAAPVYLNPAFTGADVCSRVTLLYRNQWRGFSNPYNSYLASYDHYLQNKRVGVGLLSAVDYAGAGTLKTTFIRASVSFGTRIGKKFLLRFGLQPGMGIRSVNYNHLLFGDQIYRGGSGVATVEAPMQPKTYFDMSAGALFTGNLFWLGFSVQHLNAPDESLIPGMVSRIPPLLSLHGGLKIDLNADEKDSHRKKYISPVLNYRKQKKFDQVDVGFYFTKHIFTIGCWYRGIPLLKAYRKGYQNNDALAVITGVQTERLRIGYSYDLTISNLATVSKGAHEITVSFQVCNPKKRKTRYPLISCPKF